MATGGLLRFEKVGAVASALGHQVTYVVSDDAPAPEFTSSLGALSFAEAEARAWDAVIVPGAGFSPVFIEGLKRFSAPQFGTRVQMVLNDRNVRERFIAVNRALSPDIVIFNSDDWSSGTFQDFAGKRFHHIVGAVDTELFHPSSVKTENESFVIGAQLSKNGEAVAASLDHLPPECLVRFFGFDRTSSFSALTERYGPRVENAGPLFGEDLAEYYRRLNVMVSVEAHAGWANVIAEAMASAVPVVTTRAGTLSIAKHEDTALLIEGASPGAIASALLNVMSAPDLAASRAARARNHILQFDWRIYTQRLLDVVQAFDGKAHYSHAPELGLQGKTDVASRFHGLEEVLASASGKTVLDVGAAEGIVAHEFAKRGAIVDAYEIDADRVAIGNELFGHVPNFRLNTADLTEPLDLTQIVTSAPDAGYDVVLYLGVHHHLPQDRAEEVFRAMLAVTGGYIVMRMPAWCWGRMVGVLEGERFVCERTVEPFSGSFASPLWFYRRA